MSRYRPPVKPGSHYITPEGHRALTEELDRLWRVERPLVTQSVAEAAAMGDRSENAEYIYGKKRLREIDRRVRFLRKRLEALKVVDQLPANRSRIYFGAWVELVNGKDERRRYRLVGPDEIDPARRYISIDSPLGRALLGKEAGDEIRVTSPSGIQEYEILDVAYGERDGE